MSSIENHSIFTFKYLIVGDGAVGKTSIAQRLYRNVFIIETTPTVGIEFIPYTMKIDDKTIKLRIWDTAGQEKYRSIGKAYYRNAIGIILVFALNDVKSFESISLWLQKVQQYCHPNAKFLLVGNKNDLMIERYVSQEKIEEFVHKHNLDYCEASAKADFNITNCFNILTQKVYQAVINHEIIIQEPNNENIGQKKYSNDKCKC